LFVHNITLNIFVNFNFNLNPSETNLSAVKQSRFIFSFYRLDGMIDLRNTPKKLCHLALLFYHCYPVDDKKELFVTDYVIFLLLSPTAEEH